uniref:Uncharacterized protein n=1 Tax=Macrostomum lignano TaxID=282301 RepID=A0A1I8F8J0_9PLAT
MPDITCEDHSSRSCCDVDCQKGARGSSEDIVKSYRIPSSVYLTAASSLLRPVHERHCTARAARNTDLAARSRREATCQGFDGPWRLSAFFFLGRPFGGTCAALSGPNDPAARSRPGRTPYRAAAVLPSARGGQIGRRQKQSRKPGAAAPRPDFPLCAPCFDTKNRRTGTRELHRMLTNGSRGQEKRAAAAGWKQMQPGAEAPSEAGTVAASRRRRSWLSRAQREAQADKLRAPGTAGRLRRRKAAPAQAVSVGWLRGRQLGRTFGRKDEKREAEIETKRLNEVAKKK